MELKHVATRAARLSVILKEDMMLSTGLMNKLKWDDRLLVNGQPQHTDYLNQNPRRIIQRQAERQAKYYRGNNSRQEQNDTEGIM